MSKTHTFDWHKENKDNTFLAWALLHFTGFSRIGEERHQALSDATDKFTNVQLGITINGIEVDAKVFMEALDSAMDWAAESEARKMIEEMDQLGELNDTIAELSRAVGAQIRQVCREKGIPFEDERY